MLRAAGVDTRRRPYNVEDLRRWYVDERQAFQRLAETYWFENQIPYLAHAGLAALNHAENAPPPPELARAPDSLAVRNSPRRQGSGFRVSGAATAWRPR